MFVGRSTFVGLLDRPYVATSASRGDSDVKDYTILVVAINSLHATFLTFLLLSYRILCTGCPLAVENTPVFCLNHHFTMSL